MSVSSKPNNQNLDFKPLSHEFGSTTHLKEIDPGILEPYGSAPLFINGDFDFTNLILNNDYFSITSTDGEYYSSPDNPNYSGMVYYGRQGDVDGDGANELVISGWGPDGKNTSGRVYVLNLDESGEIIDYAWKNIPGTAAPWVYDFDSDGIAEIFAIGFLDFPVNPTHSIYFQNGILNSISVGHEIDSHESSMVDYDGDGDMDIIAISYNKVNGLISLFENQNGSFEHKYIPETNSYITSGSSIDFGDIDGDGIGEFVIGDYNSDGGLAVLRLEVGIEPDWVNYETILSIRPYFEDEKFNDIDSLFTSSWDAPANEIAKMRSHDIVLKLIDIDNDGDNDLINSTTVWSNETPMGVLQILINDGLGNFSDETENRLYNYPLTALAGHDLEFIDLNQDGFFDIYVPEGSAFNDNYHAENPNLQEDLALISEGNMFLLNDGEGHFLNIDFATFGSLTEKFYPNKWYPVISSEGNISFVQLDHTWDNHPYGEKTVFNVASLTQNLFTGPKFINPAEYGVPGFNEFFVLKNNLNVQNLVKDGVFGSALEWYVQSDSPIEIFAKDAKIWGSIGSDFIELREGNETAYGLDGDDYIYGGDGDDNLDGGTGINYSNGGSGKDTIILEGNGTFGSNLVALNISSSLQTGTNERINLTGKTRFEDVMDGGADIDTVELTHASDAFFSHDSFSGFHSSLELINDFDDGVGTVRIENIENINAGDGDDIIDLTSPDYSLAGQDITVNAGAGNDTLWGSDANETLQGGEGNDELFGGAGINELIGGVGADEFQFTRTSTNDTIADFDITEGDTLKFFNTGEVQFDLDSVSLNSTGDELSIAYGTDANDVMTITLTNAGLQLGDLTSDVLYVDSFIL